MSAIITIGIIPDYKPALKNISIPLNYKEVFCGPVGDQVWYLIAGCHLCVGSTATSGIAEDLSQYCRGC